MSGLVELEQAARLHRLEDRWLAHCADRLRGGRTAGAAEPDVDEGGDVR